MLYNKLSSWLKENKLFVTKNSGKSITHLCLDGGALHVPKDEYPEFMKRYKKCLDDPEEKYFICEVPTAVCRMYVDMDIIGDKKMDIDAMEQYFLGIRDVVNSFFGEYDFIVCSTDNKDINRGGQDLIKTGYHLYWPTLFVTPSTAEKLCFSIKRQFEEKYGNLENFNTWGEILDSAVYSSSNPSLRMVGSRRATRVKGDIVDLGRPYMPHSLVSSGGITPIRDPHKFVDLCSLRVWEAETPWIKDLEPACKFVERSPRNSVDVKIADIEADVQEEIEEFIGGIDEGVWKNCEIRSITDCTGPKDKTKTYWIRIDSMYCMNVGRDHNSCGIYFVLKKTGIVQKCFCRCDTDSGRLNGKCVDYSSRVYKLPKKLSEKIFSTPAPAAVTKSNINVFHVGNSFPQLSMLTKDPAKFREMLRNTSMYFENKTKN
jgi:hypothetical protein